MAEIQASLLQTPDPKFHILSHHQTDAFDFTRDGRLQLTTDSYFMERGPRYKAYSELRESKIRSKRLQFDEDERESKIARSEFTPTAKKCVRFQESLPLPCSGRKQQGYSVLAQSVPDLSLVARKENRNPPENLITKALTPPPATTRREKMCGSGFKDGGSKSVNSGDKKSVGRFISMGNARKCCASIEVLKGFSVAASTAINAECRGGNRGNVLRKSSVFSTQYY